jgi:hypothetical protein
MDVNKMLPMTSLEIYKLLSSRLYMSYVHCFSVLRAVPHGPQTHDQATTVKLFYALSVRTKKV